MPRQKCLAILDLSNNRICCFCGLSTNDELEYGKIYEYDDIVAHYYCLLLSSNMQQNGNDDDGILGFLTEDIQKELSKAKKRQCRYCKKRGATLKCCNTKCKITFHLPCGLRNGSLHQFFGEFRSFCKNHRPLQRIDPVVKTQLETLSNLLCYICYDSVNPHNVVETLWAPCCRKNAWYHRKCVQQLALSAGYFFKCPLCNNKEEFQKAMLNCGIFIPSQDASWELVPNAYEELLYRHDRCDAKICLCPKGRNYSSNETKWELTLCRLCGSQGIHVACGRLKNANTIWECSQCTDILNKSDQNVTPTIRQNIKLNSRYSDYTVMSKESDSDNSDSNISVGRNSPLTVKFDDERYLLPLSRNIVKPGPLSYKMQQVRKFINNNKQLKSLSDKLNLASEFNNKDFQNVSRLNQENCTIESDSLQKNIFEESETLVTIDSDEEIVEIENPKQPIRCESVSTLTEGASNVSQYLSKFSRQMDLPNKNLTEINNSMHNACLIDPGANEIVFSSPTEISPQCNILENLETSGLNIKIVNVTSVSPEDFAGVSDKSEESSSSVLSVQSNGLCYPVDTEQSILKRKINLRWSNINMLHTKKFADNDVNKKSQNNPGPSTQNENQETMRNDKCEKRKQNFDMCTSFFGVPNSMKKLAAKSQTGTPCSIYKRDHFASETWPNAGVQVKNVANNQSSGAEVTDIRDTWDKAQSMEENVREVSQDDSPEIATRRSRISRPIESDESSSSRDSFTKKAREENSLFDEQNSSICDGDAEIDASDGSESCQPNMQDANSIGTRSQISCGSSGASGESDCDISDEDTTQDQNSSSKFRSYSADCSESSSFGDSFDPDRLIPGLMRLCDLKFSVCGSNVVQMSVRDNITMTIKMNDTRVENRIKNRRFSKRRFDEDPGSEKLRKRLRIEVDEDVTEDSSADGRSLICSDSTQSVNDEGVWVNESSRFESLVSPASGAFRLNNLNGNTRTKCVTAKKNTRVEHKENLDPSSPKSSNSFRNVCFAERNSLANFPPSSTVISNVSTTAVTNCKRNEGGLVCISNCKCSSSRLEHGSIRCCKANEDTNVFEPNDDSRDLSKNDIYLLRIPVSMKSNDFRDTSLSSKKKTFYSNEYVMAGPSTSCMVSIDLARIQNVEIKPNLLFQKKGKRHMSIEHLSDPTAYKNRSVGLVKSLSLGDLRVSSLSSPLRRSSKSMSDLDKEKFQSTNYKPKKFFGNLIGTREIVDDVSNVQKCIYNSKHDWWSKKKHVKTSKW